MAFLKDRLEDSVFEHWIDSMSVAWNSLRTKAESIIARSFFWMWLVLLIAFGIAYYVSWLIQTWDISMVAFSKYFIFSAIWWFILVIVMSFGWMRMSYSVLAILLLLFWVAEGFWLSGIFLTYSLWSITNIFLMTSIMFFGLAIAWYSLNIDITKWGSVLLFALIALIVGFLVNIFLFKSGQFDFVLNIIGLLIFSWFVIYDMSLLKTLSLSWDSRVELIMALSLFLDFINIFLFLLDLFTSNSD